MKHNTDWRLYKCFFSIIVILLFTVGTVAQQVPAASEAMCIGCNRSMSYINKYGHGANCPYGPKKAASSGSGVVLSPSNNLNMMIAGTVMQSLLSSLFSGPSPQQQQQKLLQQQQQQQLLLQQQIQQQKIKDSIDNALYLKLKGSYKNVEGSQKLGFKNLNGDMETMSAAAREPFDAKLVIGGGDNNSTATNFFGTKMPVADIQTLVYPEKDPVIVDVEKTNQYLKEKKREDSIKKADLEKQQVAKKSVECETLQKRYDSYVSQREKFQKTINLTDNELSEWKKKNTEALKNAAWSGLDVVLNTKVFGDVGGFKKIEKRGEEAENIKQRLLPYMDQLRLKGVDVDNYLKTLNARIFNKNLIKSGEKFKDAAEYDAFVRDGLQAWGSSSFATDSTFQHIVQDPNVQMVLNDNHPEVDVAGFVEGKMIEKLLKTEFMGTLLKFDNRIPYVSYAQFAVDEIYNATDFILSYKRIVQQREVQGKELEAAMSLQMQIDKMYDQLKTCSTK